MKNYFQEKLQNGQKGIERINILHFKTINHLCIDHTLQVAYRLMYELLACCWL